MLGDGLGRLGWVVFGEGGMIWGSWVGVMVWGGCLGGYLGVGWRGRGVGVWGGHLGGSRAPSHTHLPLPIGERVRGGHGPRQPEVAPSQVPPPPFHRF